MTLPGLSLYLKESKTDKKSARETVKVAKTLYKEGNITEEMLRTIAEWALALEITENMERKFTKNSRRFGG